MKMDNSIVQPLFDNKIDIIGDIHGEYDALVNLLLNMGYDLKGNHTEDRKLVFVGDLCDRGPDSPAVIKLVKTLVENGNAQAILGNHEMNLLQDKAKDGAGWFFKERESKDLNYEPFQRVGDDDKNELVDFLSTLPLALENEQLRIVHATWDNENIDKLRLISQNDMVKKYKEIETQISQSLISSGVLSAYHKEKETWDDENINAKLPFLEATCAYNLAHQMNNPIRVITSGVEERATKPFYASGKWRFVERYSWWDRYEDNVPVVVGHFWRKWHNDKNPSAENVFANIEPTSWHGKNNNVFCVDFSVGGRFKERNANKTVGENTKLAALRWPECDLILETGEVIPTTNFKYTNRKMKV